MNMNKVKAKKVELQGKLKELELQYSAVQGALQLLDDLEQNPEWQSETTSQ